MNKEDKIVVGDEVFPSLDVLIENRNHFKLVYELYFTRCQNQAKEIEQLKEEIQELKEKAKEQKLAEIKGNEKAMDTIYKLVCMVENKNNEKEYDEDGEW